MKKFFGKKSANQDGSVLLAVLTIMTFASLVAATAFSFVRQASERSIENVREKQAYYTASTCLETFMDSVLTPDNPNWDSFELIAEAGGVSEPIDLDGMGTCVIKVEKGTGYIKVISTATLNNGEEDTVACFLRSVNEPGESPLKNAIELKGTSDAYYDNLNVLGNVVGTNDTNENMVYKLGNEAKIYGKYQQYGTVVAHNMISFKNSVSDEGVSLTASKYVYLVQNEPSIISEIAKQNDNTSNYVNAGNTFVTDATHVKLGKNSSYDPTTGVRTGDVDLFAPGVVLGLKDMVTSNTYFSRLVAMRLTTLSSVTSTLVTQFGTGNSYVQYGNVYCFAAGGANTGGDTNAELAGNFVVDMGSGMTVEIHGDVYIEGNLYIAPGCSFKVYGNLYVLGDIIGAYTVLEDTDRTAATGVANGFTYEGIRAATDSTLPLDASTFNAVKTTSRATAPSLEYEGTKFVYYPEDMLISDDTDVSTIGTAFKNICANPNAYSLNNYSDGDYEGIHFDKIITGSCYMKNSDMNNVNNILIEVTGPDVIIVFENGLNLNNGRKILVKNTTKSLEDSTSGTPGFCYFAVDTITGAPGTPTVTPQYKKDDAGADVLDSHGKKIVVDSLHSGFVENASIYMDNVCIGDYDTWKNGDVGYSVAGVSCGTMPINITGREIPGTYDPGYGYIFYFLTKGTQINAQNACQFEGTFYANEANVTYNATAPTMKLVTGDSGSPMEISEPVFALGSLITGKLDVGNRSFVAFREPSSRSTLSKASVSGTEKVVGYDVLKYSQNLN